MKLSRWAPLAVTCVLGTVAFTNAFWTFGSQRQLFTRLRQQQCEEVIEETHTAFEETGVRAASFAATVAAMPSVALGFSQNDRAGVLRETAPVLAALRERYNVELIHFHHPDTVTFLRVHKPEKFGDNLSHRELVVGANLKKTPQSGVEASASGVAIRGITPVNWQGRHLGTVETGMPFQPVLENISRRTGFQLGIYVNKEKVAESQGRKVGLFVEVAVTDSELLAQAVPEGGVKLIQDDITQDEALNDTVYGVVRMPLLDVSNHNIGTIVALKPFRDLVKTQRAALLQAILQAVLLTVLGAGVVAAVFKGLLLRPLGALAQAVREDNAEVFESLAQRQDEIGDVAQSLKDRP